MYATLLVCFSTPLVRVLQYTIGSQVYCSTKCINSQNRSTLFSNKHTCSTNQYSAFNSSCLKLVASGAFSNVIEVTFDFSTTIIRCTLPDLGGSISNSFWDSFHTKQASIIEVIYFSTTNMQSIII